MSKYGPFAIGARERSRLAWRQRVDAAARAYRSARMAWRARVRDGKFGTFEWQAFKELADAVAAPRPWRSQRKPDPRRRYSRSHRRACRKCRAEKWLRSDIRWSVRYGYAGLTDQLRTDLAIVRRDPHGRSDR